MNLFHFQLALDYGIKFMETSAKANINVENVCNCLTLMNFERLFLLYWINLLIFPLGSQAFLTLARDIKSKMDTKLVWKTDIHCDCVICYLWGNFASKCVWIWTSRRHCGKSFLWHLQEGNAPQGGSHGVKISEPQKKTSFFRCTLLWGLRPFSLAASRLDVNGLCALWALPSLSLSYSSVPTPQKPWYFTWDHALLIFSSSVGMFLLPYIGSHSV